MFLKIYNQWIFDSEMNYVFQRKPCSFMEVPQATHVCNNPRSLVSSNVIFRKRRWAVEQRSSRVHQDKIWCVKRTSGLKIVEWSRALTLIG